MIETRTLDGRHLRHAQAAHSARSYSYNVGLAYADVAARLGSQPALRLGGDAVVTHAELNALSNKLAFFLTGSGIVRGDVVAIVHTKTPVCYALMLACLKLGAMYVNLDDANPVARLTHIVHSARPRLIAYHGMSAPAAGVFGSLGIRVADVGSDAVRAQIDVAPAGEPRQCQFVNGADPAYIMFTSGSTGGPKGVMITHANVLNFGAWTGSRLGITPADALTNLNPMYFDNSVFDFYAALLNGASLAPIGRELLANPPALLAHIEAAECTFWFSVPSFLIYLTTLELLSMTRLPAVHTFVFGGEGYPKPELRKLFALFGERSRLVNVYGPTECTCICSAWDVQAGDLDEPEALVTLGPIAGNFSTLILDDERNPVAAGATGELHLLGPQVGLGYVNDHERTADAFVANPANRVWHERMYRTGDLVRQRTPGGAIDFVGRKDNQIKHMGYRIELEEIEGALNAIGGIIQAAVVATTIDGLKTLVAFVASERDVPDAHLRRQLALTLPPYMIPQRFVQRRILTKNANGKIDRIALAEGLVR
jgi:D-alanine--poly(phosphoribitol) ligase subunit 1